MPQYHVTLGGVGFLLDPGGYRVRAPAQPAGALPVLDAPAGPTASVAFERVQRQASFAAGEGRADGWRTGTGRSVLAAPDGALTLGPALVDCGAGAVFGPGARAFAVFRGRLYAGLDGAPGQVWSSADGATWSLAFSTGKPGVRSLAAYRDALYVGNGGDGVVQRWDGASLSVAWTNPDTASIDALCVAWFGGAPRLFVGNSGAPGFGAWLQTYDGTTQGTVAFLDEPRLEALAVGPDGRLYVCAAAPSGQPRGALYSYAGSAASYALERASGDGYAVAAVPLDRRLVLGWSDGRLRAWEPGAESLEDLPLPGGASGGEGALRAVAVQAGALWSAVREAGGDASLRRHEPGGGAWSLRAAVGATGDAALSLVPFGGALYLGVGLAAGGARIYRADPAAAAASGEAEIGPVDAGLPDLEKQFRTASVRHAPLPAGASVALDWRPEPAAGSAWQALGTSAAGGAEEATFSFPAGAAGRAVALRARLTRGPGPGDTPRLRALAVRVALAPPLKREWRFGVLLEGDAARPLLRLDNTPEPRTARQMAQALWSLRAQPGPLAFADLEGTTRQVWFRDLEEVPQKTTTSLDPTAPWSLGHVTLVEA